MNDVLPSPTSVTDTSDPDKLVEAIVRAVADAAGLSPLELRPLATVIDPDALCTLFRTNGSALVVEFRYHDFRVRVSSSGREPVMVSLECAEVDGQAAATDRTKCGMDGSSGSF